MVKQLEFPIQERLLPIGLQRDSVVGFVERDHQVLNLSDLQGTSLFIENRQIYIVISYFLL